MPRRLSSIRPGRRSAGVKRYWLAERSRFIDHASTDTTDSRLPVLSHLSLLGSFRVPGVEEHGHLAFIAWPASPVFSITSCDRETSRPKVRTAGLGRVAFFQGGG